MTYLKTTLRPLLELPGYGEAQAPPALRHSQQAITLAAFAVAPLAMAVMAILTCIEVLMRYFLDNPLGWNVNFTEQYLMVGLSFLGLTVGYRTGGHVAVASIYDRLPPRGRKTVMMVAQAVMIASCIPIFISGFTAAQLSLGLNETPAVGGAELPLNYGLWKSLVPIGTGLFILTVLIDLIRESFSRERGPITEVADSELPVETGGEDR